MKWRRPKLYAVMAWIITLALSLSPVMAQNAQELVETSKDNPNPFVDTSVLPELPLATTAAAFPAVSRDSTLPSAAPSPTKPSSTDVSPGGKSKWIILATIIGTAAVVGIILLLRGIGGGDDKSHPPSPKGTIITAGPPSVSPPSR